jgi:hypothetical protein
MVFLYPNDYVSQRSGHPERGEGSAAGPKWLSKIPVLTLTAIDLEEDPSLRTG